MGIKNKWSIRKIMSLILLALIVLSTIFLGVQYNRFLKIKSENIKKINSKSIVAET